MGARHSPGRVRAHSCVIAETVKDLATWGALCVSCQKRDANEEPFGGVPIEDVGAGSSFEPDPVAWDLVKLDGDAISVWPGPSMSPVRVCASPCGSRTHSELFTN